MGKLVERISGSASGRRSGQGRTIDCSTLSGIVLMYSIFKAASVSEELMMTKKIYLRSAT